MKSLLLVIVMLGTAYADRFPDSGPCDDVEACEAACAKSKGACFWGGVLVMQTVKEDRFAHAAELFERGCTKGSIDACFNAGEMLAIVEWQTDKKRGPRSLAAYKRACDKNHARACGAYAYGLKELGDAKSLKLAAAAFQKKVRLLERRCTKEKMAGACNMLWSMYEYGEGGVEKDPDKAKKWGAAGEKLRTPAP